MIDPSRLAQIIGQRMSAVSFVHDYVEVHFDGKILRSLTNPRVVSSRGQLTFPEPGSRDALCELIGKSVVNVIVQAPEYIEVRFGASAFVRIPLSNPERIGPEAAHFVPGDNQPIEVW